MVAVVTTKTLALVGKRVVAVVADLPTEELRLVHLEANVMDLQVAGLEATSSDASMIEAATVGVEAAAQMVEERC